MRLKILAFSLILVFVATAGLGCKTLSREVKDSMQPVVLNYWRVWEGPDDFAELIGRYNAQHPYVNINYRKLTYEEYENALVDALAEDRGPDIFSIQNTWVKKYQTKIAPMPETITMVYPIEKGTIKKEVIPELRTTRSISAADVRNAFIDTVYQDVVISAEGKQFIYGLPLSVDTMVMFFNKDLLNNAGIAELPPYWNRDFQEAIKKLTRQDARGEILQAGVALGGGDSIERSVDILATLMMQNGAVMMENNSVMFNQVPNIFRERGYNPGMEAVRFYTDFANPAKEVYSWNDDLENSLQQFINGRLAIFFGYAYNLPVIKAQAPRLNLGIQKFPQIEGASVEVNSANYWVETVSAKSRHKNEAWNFVQFMTTQPDNAKIFLERTKKPTALRTLIPGQLEDDDLKVFASQLLTAKSWYRGRDVISAERALHEMIEAVVMNPDNLVEAVNLSASRIQQTIY